jgi:hypothetical protein
MALGDLYTRKGRYPDGLAIDERLARLRGEDPFILYNHSCSYALLGNVAQAAETMKKAIACGYRDFARLERDRDLVNLLSDEGFQKYLKSQKRKRSSSATNP